MEVHDNEQAFEDALQVVAGLIGRQPSTSPARNSKAQPAQALKRRQEQCAGQQSDGIPSRRKVPAVDIGKVKREPDDEPSNQEFAGIEMNVKSEASPNQQETDFIGVNVDDHFDEFTRQEEVTAAEDDDDRMDEVSNISTDNVTIESVQARIRYLEGELQTSASANLSEPGRSNNTLVLPRRTEESRLMDQPTNFRLPKAVIKQLLKAIPDQKTLLNCRLLCVEWNEIVEDTSELMKKITFPIWHPKLFLDLSIVQKGKIKAVSFRNCSPLEYKYKNAIMNAIKNNVEKVTFEFDRCEDSNAQQQNKLFLLVLENCKVIQELTVIYPEHLFNGITRSTTISSANNINIFTVKDVDQLKEENVDGLLKFLLKLPVLEEINLVRSTVANCVSSGFGSSLNLKILTGLCEYLSNSDACPMLKKLTLPFNSIAAEYEHQKICTLLLLLCNSKKRRYPIVLQELSGFNLTYLLKFKVTAAKRPSFKQCPMFVAKINAELTFDGPALTNLSRLNSLNIRKLILIFKRDIMKGELKWLNTVQGLEELVLNTILDQDQNGSTKRLGGTSIVEFENSLAAGLTSLKTLFLCNDMFDSIRIFNWAQYFPNLCKLTIEYCNITPNILLAELAVGLKSLSALTLDHLPNLSDAAFTTVFGSTMAARPAIACFSSLKFLEIIACNSLTNICVLNGIANKSTTLEIVHIYFCEGMTIECKYVCDYCDFEVCIL